MNNTFRFHIGQFVHIAPDKFPQGHRPTRGNLYRIAEQWAKEDNSDDPFNSPGNYYGLKEVPSGAFREDYIAEVQPAP